MKRRIFKNMCFLAGGICFLAYTILFFVFNYVFGVQNEKYVQNEAYYLASALNEMDSSESRIRCLEDMKENSPTRVTWINGDGQVLFDNVSDTSGMDNHLERPEIEQAFKEGASSSVRHSSTLEESTYYYAMLLEDDTVIRLSVSTKSVYAMYFSTLPVLLIIFVVFLGIILLLARRITNAIVSPINNIDLVKPEDGCPYEELRPLLGRIHRQNEERQKVEKMRREFSANVSHELKTPLTSISGYAELMKDGMVRPEDVPTFAEKIYKEAARLIGLVNDIIKISRLDERKIGIEKEPVDLREIADEVHQRLETILQKYKVSMEVLGGHVMTQGVPQMMEELFYNLCENAIKYNRSGGHVYVRLDYADGGDDEAGKARIVVEDTGIGIPNEHFERIFERFYRVDKSHSRQSGGTGLGLAIVKHVVEYHDGDISLESAVGKGTRITVTL